MVTIYDAGNFAILVTDANNNTGQSNAFSVVAVPNHYAFAMDGGATSNKLVNQLFTITVTALDAGGNIVQNFNGSGVLYSTMPLNNGQSSVDYSFNAGIANIPVSIASIQTNGYFWYYVEGNYIDWSGAFSILPNL